MTDAAGAYLTGELERLDRFRLSYFGPVQEFNRDDSSLWAMELRFPTKDVEMALDLNSPIDADYHLAMVTKWGMDQRNGEYRFESLRRTPVSLRGDAFYVTYFCGIKRAAAEGQAAA